MGGGHLVVFTVWSTGMLALGPYNQLARLMLASYIVWFNGAHNDVRTEGKGKSESVQRARKRLEFENVPNVVPLLFLVSTRTCPHTYTKTLQRMRKRKASIRTPSVVKQRKDIVTDLDNCYTTTYSIQPLHSQARRPLGRSFRSWWLLGTYPSALTDTILCLTPIFATLLVLYSVDEAIRVCEETFSNFNLLRGCCMLLPLLRHYAFLLRKTWETTATVKSLCLQSTADAGVIMSKIVHSWNFAARITTADSLDLRIQKSRLSLHSLQY